MNKGEKIRKKIKDQKRRGLEKKEKVTWAKKCCSSKQLQEGIKKGKIIDS